jgi:hypothetical protein
MTRKRSSVALLLLAAAVSWFFVLSWQALETWDFLKNWHFLKPPHASWLGLVVSLLVGAVLAAGLILPRRPRYLAAVLGALALVPILTSHQILALAAVLWFLGLAFLIGIGPIRLTVPGLPSLGSYLLAVCFGLGIEALLVLVLGLLGLLSLFWVLSITLLVGGGLAWLYRGQGIPGSQLAPSGSVSSGRARPDPLALACAAGLVVFAFANWFGALAPEVHFDALSSHLALAKVFTEQQRVSGFTSSMASFWPLGGDLLITLGYLGGGETAGKLFQFVAGLCAAGFAFLAADRLHSRRAGWVAALVFYTTPIVAWESTTAYLDLFLVMYLGAALALLAVFVSRPDWRIALMIGCFLGFGLGVKLTAAFLAAGILVAMLAPVTGRSGYCLKSRLTAVVTAAAAMTLLGGGWYLRTYLLTGNPVFPFLNGIFQSPLWYPTNTTFNFSQFGIGTSAVSAIVLPWRLTFETSRFGEIMSGSAGMLYLALLPFAALALKQKKVLVAIVLPTLGFLTCWFFTAQYLRYLIPGLLGLAVLAGWSGGELHARFSAFSARLAWLMPTLLLTSVLGTFWLHLPQYWNIPTRIPYPVVLGWLQPEEYRARVVPCYDTWTHLNKQLRKDDTVYAVNHAFRYFSDSPIYSPFFSLIGDRILKAETEEDLLAHLRSIGARYIVFDEVTRQNSPWNFLITRQSFLARHAVFEYAAHEVQLYRLLEPAEKREKRQLLQNDGLKNDD